ncbi:glycosyltransferase family protein [bacterium]|nr:glycosyltransferase family protein [bacterium]
MGSSRLAGKVLKDLGGKSMLARVTDRTKRSQKVHQVIVATSTDPRDSEIVSECQKLQVLCFRGSEQDVLDRYYRAAKEFGSDSIVRITSDCPFIDPQVIDQVVSETLASGADYGSNTLARTYPRGLDVEVFSFQALEKAWKEAKEPAQRTHVTPYLYQNPRFFRTCSVVGSKDWSRYRWTVDTIEDYEFALAIYSKFKNSDQFDYQNLLDLMEKNSDLVKMNQHIQQKSLHEG